MHLSRMNDADSITRLNRLRMHFRSPLLLVAGDRRRALMRTVQVPLCASLCLIAWSCAGAIAVDPQVPTSMLLRPATLTFSASGEFGSFLATLYDQNGRTIRGTSVDWTSSDASVARVNGNGGVTSVGDGTATMTATVGSVSATAEVTVVVPTVVVEYRSVTAGDGHSCAVSTTRNTYCWGANGYSQLGDGFSLIDRNAPVPVNYSPAVHSLAAGLHHTCAVVSGGANLVAACWGRSDVGQVGQTGPSGVVGTPRWMRTSQGTALSVQSVASGDKHGCVVTTDSEAYCWAKNASGQLGDGTTELRFAATPVVGGLAFDSISAGGDHTCALTASGAAYCWGENDAGQLGNGTNTDSSVPVAVAGGLTFASLTGRCGLTTDGDAYCWGENTSGQLGDGTSTESNVPVAVSGGLVFQEIASGDAFSCGVTMAGDGYCWGSNAAGQLGNGTTANSNIPVPVSGGLTFQAIAGGFDHGCGVTTDGDAHCWGDNASGQLGDGTNTSSSVPVRVGG